MGIAVDLQHRQRRQHPPYRQARLFRRLIRQQRRFCIQHPNQRQLIVGKPLRGSTIPVVSVEDPRYVISHDDPATGETLAALKMTRDEWDTADVAHLYLPGGVLVYRRRTKSQSLGTASFRFGFGDWELDDDASGGYPGLPSDLVPVVHARNRRGKGEYEPHLEVLDRINDTIFDRLKIAKAQAHKSMAIDGLPDYDEATGEKIDYSNAFVSSPGSMWKIPAGSKIWESSAVDLSPIRMAIKDDVEAFAAVVGMPLHYVTPDAAQGSAEGASTMKESTIFRTEDRRRRAGVALEDVMALAFAAMGDKERAHARSIKTKWLPAERHSLQERSQAFSVQRAAGMPFQIAARDVLGYGADDLPRIEAARTTDLFFSNANA